MSTPILFIGVPAVLAFALFFIRSRQNLTLIISMSLFGVLSLLAFFHNFEQLLKIGPLSIDLGTTFSILGRDFILSNSDRLFLTLTCLTSFFWLGGIKQAGINKDLIPYQMALMASLTAALAVDPFIYSAIFMEIAVLLSIPMLVHTGQTLSRGVLRFLIFQSISMPLILLGGWLIAGSQASPSNLQQLGIAAFFLATGFALWLAVFPFHSWVPQLSEGIHPYISGFLLTVFPQVALLVVVDLTSSVTWIMASEYYGKILLSVGSIMMVIVTIWLLFEKNAKKIYGYLVLFETSFLLLLLGMQTPQTTLVFFLTQFPRFVALLLGSFCLTILINRGSMRLDLKGSFTFFPFASIGLLTAFFSIIGLPPFGEFAYKFALLDSIGNAGKIKPIWLIIGFSGVLIPLFGLVLRIFSKNDSTIKVNEKIPQIVIISFGVFLLLLLGLYPRGLLGLVETMAQFLPLK